MADLFLMPKLGMDMEEGTVIRRLKAEGETVCKGEPLAEIETDKSTLEVESPFEGVLLQWYCAEEEALPCGAPLAAIGPSGEAPPVFDQRQPKYAAPARGSEISAEEPLGTEPAAAAERGDGKLRASPRARRLAEQMQVDLRQVPSTGLSGRIVEQDVRQYLAASPHAARPCRETVSPLSAVRKITARRMCQSLSEMAQACHRTEVDMRAAVSFRRQLNAGLEQRGEKVSFGDLITAVCAKALMEFPEANASLREDGLHTMDFVNLGIAVDTERGLVVPVIRDADLLTLPEISQRSRELIEKARNGQLRPDEMNGGTFTISNLGMYEIDSFTAIVNPPETCILAAGRICDRAAAENGRAVVRPTMLLSLTYDHRVLDGAPAARFLQAVKHLLENPVRLLL